MQRLPPRRRRSIWPLAAGILAGVGAFWLTMPALHINWVDWIHGELSASIITVMLMTTGMSLLAALVGHDRSRRSLRSIGKLPESSLRGF